MREVRPHLIISDVAMPVMNRYTMCRAIKDDGKLREIPVILLTSLSDTQDVMLGVEAGGDYYMTKPYQTDFCPRSSWCSPSPRLWRCDSIATAPAWEAMLMIFLPPYPLSRELKRKATTAASASESGAII